MVHRFILRLSENFTITFFPHEIKSYLEKNFSPVGEEPLIAFCPCLMASLPLWDEIDWTKCQCIPLHLDTGWILKHHQSSPASCRLYSGSSGRETPEGKSGGWAMGLLGRREMATAIRVRLCRGQASRPYPVSMKRRKQTLGCGLLTAFLQDDPVCFWWSLCDWLVHSWVFVPDWRALNRL